MIWIPKIRQSATQARCSLCRSVQAKIDSCGAATLVATALATAALANAALAIALADTFLSAAAFTAAPVPLASVRARRTAAVHVLLRSFSSLLSAPTTSQPPPPSPPS